MVVCLFVSVYLIFSYSTWNLSHRDRLTFVYPMMVAFKVVHPQGNIIEEGHNLSASLDETELQDSDLHPPGRYVLQFAEFMWPVETWWNFHLLHGFWHHMPYKTVETSRNKIASDCHCYICWVSCATTSSIMIPCCPILSAQDVSRFQCRGRWASCRPGWPLTWRGTCLSWPWKAQGWNLHKLGGAMWWLEGTRAKFLKTTLLVPMANFLSASNSLSALQSLQGCRGDIPPGSSKMNGRFPAVSMACPTSQLNSWSGPAALPLALGGSAIRTATDRVWPMHRWSLTGSAVTGWFRLHGIDQGWIQVQPATWEGCGTSLALAMFNIL